MEIPQKLPIFAAKLMKSIVMCTYKITVKDTLIDRVRPAFVDNHEIAKWMQQQLEVILLQLAAQMEGKNAERGLSQRLRGIAHAPKDFDYKAELANRYHRYHYSQFSSLSCFSMFSE